MVETSRDVCYIYSLIHNTMKKVYLVSGNQDGILGIFTNIKKAYARSVEYGGGSASTNETVMTYAKTCKALKEVGIAYVVESSYAESQIDIWYINE